MKKHKITDEELTKLEEISLSYLKLINSYKKLLRENKKLKESNDRLQNFKSIIICNEFYNSLTEEQKKFIHEEERKFIHGKWN